MKWMMPCLLMVVLLVVHGLSNETPTLGNGLANRRAIVFGLDGVRSDALKLAVDTGRAPNIAKLIENGAVTWAAVSGGWTASPSDPTRQATYSGPGWASVLTGVWTDKHGVTGNDFSGKRFDEYPHFFKRVKDAVPEAEMKSLVSWAPIHEHVREQPSEEPFCECLTYTEGGYDVADAALTAKTVELLSQGNPDVMFHYQGNIDNAGHGYGFSPEVPEYMDSIELADRRIGEVLDAVRKRPRFSREDWLFIVTTDHGGIGKGHGGHTPEERIIPFIASGGKVPKGLISSQVVGQVAVPATVFRHLGMGIPADWGWEADGFGNGTNLEVIHKDGRVALRWTVPSNGFSGGKGYEIRRNGERVATLDAKARRWIDENPGEGHLVYGLTAIGSGEGEWTARVNVPVLPVSLEGAPDFHLAFDGNFKDTVTGQAAADAEGAPMFIEGKSGKAVRVGNGAYVRIGDEKSGAPDVLRFGDDTDFTFAFWVKTDARWEGDPVIVSNKDWSNGANPGWAMTAQNNGKTWQWNLKGESMKRFDFDPTLAPLIADSWQLVTITHDRTGDAAFYHNGVEIGRVTIAGAGNVDTGFPIRIGADGAGQLMWNRPIDIDELRVWRRVLSPGEVAGLMQ